MTKKYNIAIVGATGIVGETLLELLLQRDFPVNKVFALASEKSVGHTVLFGDKPLVVNAIESFDFSSVDFAFFAAGNDISLKYAPIATKAGCIVIDKSSAFRYDDAVPLVVPEVNPEALKKTNSHLIANPNCTTIPLVVAIKPILEKFGIARINIATYQSVSGAGKQGISALATETAALLNGQEIEETTLGKQIAFNVIPKIDAFHENGYTLEEMKLVWETRKILSDPSILVNATAVRVPVFFGHSLAVTVETKKTPDVAQIKQLLQKTIGVTVVSDDDYPTPVTHAASQDAVFIGRLRKDISHDNGLTFWIVADNVRKGAALNAIQIAELFVQQSVYRH